jgi:hypothetical protein
MNRRPAFPSAPAPGEPRQVVCPLCSQPIGVESLHFLLRDGQVICGACVSKPRLVPPRTAGGGSRLLPSAHLDHVVSYGDRDTIARLLDPAQPEPGITAGISGALVAAACGSDQGRQSRSAGDWKSPLTCGAGNA